MVGIITFDLKFYRILKVACVLFSIFATCFTGSAEYTIIPASENTDIPEDLIDRSGADATLTFWELPLYFKLISIGCLLSVSLFGSLKFLPFLFGKVKINKGENNRQKILSYVSDNPGCSENDILNGLDMKRGTFRYHAGKLRLANMLVNVRNGRFTSYFRNDSSIGTKTVSSGSYLRNDTRKNVLEAILESPGVTNKELSLKLGLDKSTISWHVNELQKEDAINFEKHGRLKRYYPMGSSRISSDQRVPVFSK